MKKKVIYALLVSSLTLAIMGCSDSQKAGESNFKSAAQDFLNVAYPACYIVETFPTKPDGWDIRGQKLIYEEMVKLGLLIKKEEMTKPKSKWQKPQKEFVFDLTDEGKKYYQLPNDKNHKQGGFCFGEPKVKEITNFTEPSEMMGKKVSRINFTYIVTDFPNWIKNPDILKLSDVLKRDVNSPEAPIKIDVNMVLTNKGWIEIHLFNR